MRLVFEGIEFCKTGSCEKDHTLDPYIFVAFPFLKETLAQKVEIRSSCGLQRLLAR